MIIENQEFWKKYEQIRDQWFTNKHKKALTAAVQLYRSGMGTTSDLKKIGGRTARAAFACMVELEYKKLEETGQWRKLPNRLAETGIAVRFEDGFWYAKKDSSSVCPLCGNRCQRQYRIDNKIVEICDFCHVKWYRISTNMEFDEIPTIENATKLEILSYKWAEDVYATSSFQATAPFALYVNEMLKEIDRHIC
jgi:hypothetical protein